MSSALQLGDYQIQRESRGLRFTRVGELGPLPVTPLVYFTLTEENKRPATFIIERLTIAQEGGLDFHGSLTDRVALDGNVLYRQDLQGLEFALQLINTTSDMTMRAGAMLELTGEADPRWMIPGLFYRENRVANCPRIYPAYHEFNRDPRRMMSSHWAFRADRAALPLVMAWTYGCFGWVSTTEVFGVTPEEPGGAGMAALCFAQEDGNPRFGVEFPHRETPVRYSFCHPEMSEAEETYVLLPKRVPITLNFVLGIGPPDLHSYDPVIRAIYARNQRFHAVRAKMAPEETEREAHVGILAWHYDPNQGALFETSAFDKHFGRRGTYFERTHMHVGWQSGALPAYALLWGGRESKHQPSIEAAIQVLDKITGELSPASTLFPVWTEEYGWSCSYGPEEGTAHARTVAEACLFILRALRIELQNNKVHPQWREAVNSTLTYAMSAQQHDGAFPAYFDLTTGRPTSFEGFAGASWIASIAAAACLYHAPHFRESAVKAGEYYAAFVEDEFLHGSIEDQPLTPSADDCYWALIGYLLLYELDQNAKWLALAKRAADLAMTWRFAYNVVFPKNSMLGRYDFRTRGGDIQSVATPVTTANGLLIYAELIKLSALTGDPYYKSRAEDSRLFASQLIAREDADLNARAGMAAQSICHTDWVNPKGSLNPVSSVYTGALVRLAELTARHLNIPLAVFEGQEESDLAIELGVAPVLYNENRIEGGGASMDVPLSAIKATKLGKGLDAPPRRGPNSRDALSINPGPLNVGTPLPLPNRGTFRPQPVVEETSLPSPFVLPAPLEPESGDGEIKYKIF